jgi:hypothetical protein
MYYIMANIPLPILYYILQGAAQWFFHEASSSTKRISSGRNANLHYNPVTVAYPTGPQPVCRELIPTGSRGSEEKQNMQIKKKQ